MCGIAGVIEPVDRGIPRERLEVLSQAIAHRGPDAEGIWQASKVGLVHRRLAIVDLSPSGSQPMHFGSLSIVFNGEIYNYQALRAELESQGDSFVSTSDTEVILHLYAREGRACLERLHGMFAFAIWNADTQELFFARDRVGKKPFYYRHDQEGFVFASELEALLKDRPAKIDYDALRAFFGLQYVPSPLTGFEGIRHLEPGMCGFYRKSEVVLRRYDSFDHQLIQGMTRSDAVVEIRRLLAESVRLRLIADVDVGVFLSGGIDSSAVACLAAQQKGGGLQTFTMGFSVPGMDERNESAWLAERLGAQHHAFEAKPSDLLELLDGLVAQYASPYADSSCLPTSLLARETAKHVKVALTGDGGDEVFGGYYRYRYFLQAQQWKRFGLAKPLSFVAKIASGVFHDPRFGRFARVLDGLRQDEATGYAALFSGSYFDALAERALLQSDFLIQTKASSSEDFIRSRYQAGLGVGAMQDFEFHSYLPDDLNVKMDRAAMKYALEARSPLLDQDLVRFVMRLPSEWHFDSKQQKPLLVEAVDGMVPKEVFSRRKRGFQVPLAVWFRGELKAVFQERCLVSSSPLHQICRPEEIQRYFDAHQRGEDHGNRLWMLLVCATWLQWVKEGKFR